MSDRCSTDGVAKTRQYMDSLVPPDRERFEHIARVQAEREAAARRRRARERRRSPSSLSAGGCDSEGGGSERDEAARVIQKTFRGYRARRQMHGLSLDASSRWIAAIRDAQFRQSTKPRASTASDRPGELPVPALDDPVDRRPSSARRNWQRVKLVARHAGHDDEDSSSSSSSSSSSDDGSGPGPRPCRQRAEDRRRRQLAKAERGKVALQLRLEYFLELVDAKHRYGSNLRVYHDEWKRSDTTENFFFWLDYGGGRRLDLDACPRDRLEREQVRYLSREERQYYLVRVDADGRLCWAKNGARIDTTERFRDSIQGVVPADDPTPAFRPTLALGPSSSPAGSAASAASSASSASSAREADRAAKYEAGSVKATAHLSASTIFSKLLRKTVRPNTWIFVADTSFRLYVGIKDSGAFQHSSFLQGGRISAAGLIKIKDGRLTSLSPLSGHYRPPASNFRAFVHSLRAAGVDMGRVSISKSYTVLIGLEAYVETRRKGRELVDRLRGKGDKKAVPLRVGGPGGQCT